MRQADVAKAANVPIDQVIPTTPSAIQQALGTTQHPLVLEVALQDTTTAYWYAGGRYWFDDPFFGDVVAFDDLGYSPDYGLYDRRYLSPTDGV